MINGVFCPSITPLKTNGDIDFSAWEKHLNCLIGSGIDGILIFGSIGEFHTLTVEQKVEAIEFVSRVIDQKTKFFVGTGSTRLFETQLLNRIAAENNADAVVIVGPYYFGLTDGEAMEYFKELDTTSPLPIILYNFPARTGTDLSPEFVSALEAATTNIIGVKDTVDSAAHNRRMITATSSPFAVLSGFDEYYINNRLAGGSGVLSGLTNVAPEIFVSMHAAYESGDFTTALNEAKKISRLMTIYEVGGNFIQAIKCAVKIRNNPALSASCHEITVPLTEGEELEIKELLRKNVESD